MGGKLTKGDKILNAIRVVKNIDKEYRYDVESILYAFASKFLEGKDLERVREEIKMTELGRSLIEEGMEKGIEKGRIEGENKKTIEVVKNAIKKGMDNDIIMDLTGLSEEEIEGIRKTLKYIN